MIPALATGNREDGSPVTTVILGLDDANLHGLREDMPVLLDGRVLGVPALDVALVAARTPEELARVIRAQFKPGSARLKLSDAEVQSGFNEHRDLLLDSVRTIVEYCGARLVWKPAAEDRLCADCGGRIVFDYGLDELIHVETRTHRCADLAGCAHDAVLIDVPPNQQQQPKGDSPT